MGMAKTKRRFRWFQPWWSFVALLALIVTTLAARSLDFSDTGQSLFTIFLLAGLTYAISALVAGLVWLRRKSRSPASKTSDAKR
jgi:LPXTG-motif cell wall-anchored protein